MCRNGDRDRVSKSKFYFFVLGYLFPIVVYVVEVLSLLQ